MKRYKVEVMRTSYCSKTFEIEAENAIQAKKDACEIALNHDFSGNEYDCDYQVLEPEPYQVEMETPNEYIDRNGNPYDADDDAHCFPAGGGLHKDCEFNADALYAYYTLQDREKIFDYLTKKGFVIHYHGRDVELWVKGNTQICFECYDASTGLWVYMHTELVAK